MKNIIYIVLVVFCVGQTYAQVQFGLTSDESKKIQMSITAVGNYASPPFNQFNNSNFTFRWPAALSPQPTFTLANSSTITYQLDGTPTDGGDGFVYQKVSTFSTNVLTITSGSTIEVVELMVVGDYSAMEMTEVFEIADNSNAWVLANNGESSMENFLGEQWNGYTTQTASVILPIELRSFSAFKNDRDVDLEWSTISEANASHFDVERSKDGNNWEFLGKVNAVGESSVVQEYTFLDNTLPLNARENHKTFYYRLNMVDKDGQQEYSDIRSVRFDLDGEADFLVYPNPTVNEVFVNLSSITPESGPATLNVINMNGQLIKKVTLQTSDDIRVDVSDLTGGVYNFIVSQKEDRFSQKVIIID